mmetsp:Transcript_3359/g.7942  ORF Transcript_3359/g.7942 Transcript_3359/m.7942 type:complete len:106 (-) Transcript_3359:153-470(-)
MKPDERAPGEEQPTAEGPGLFEAAADNEATPGGLTTVPAAASAATPEIMLPIWDKSIGEPAPCGGDCGAIMEVALLKGAEATVDSGGACRLIVDGADFDGASGTL